MKRMILVCIVAAGLFLFTYIVGRRALTASRREIPIEPNREPSRPDGWLGRTSPGWPFAEAPPADAGFAARLAALEARLDRAEPARNAHAPEPHEKRAPRPDRVTPTQFASWIDEELRVGGWDRDATRELSDQIAETLKQRPEIGFEDVECGQRFCRASFLPEQGGPSALDGVYGEPPFISGFSAKGADGQVFFYFPRAGQSLEALQAEAMQAVAQRSGTPP